MEISVSWVIFSVNLNLLKKNTGKTNAKNNKKGEKIKQSLDSDTEIAYTEIITEEMQNKNDSYVKCLMQKITCNFS